MRDWNCASGSCKIAGIKLQTCQGWKVFDLSAYEILSIIYHPRDVRDVKWIRTTERRISLIILALKAQNKSKVVSQSTTILFLIQRRRKWPQRRISYKIHLLEGGKLGDKRLKGHINEEKIPKIENILLYILQTLKTTIFLKNDNNSPFLFRGKVHCLSFSDRCGVSFPPRKWTSLSKISRLNNVTYS